MKIVVQRSLSSRVEVEGATTGRIEHGLVLLICFEQGDTKEALSRAAEKILSLRIFDDPDTGRLDKNLADVNGQILCISQFTLSWDGKKGNRPSFDRSMPPQEAQIFFKLFCEHLRDRGAEVQIGRFGAKMDVHIHNPGPVTFFLDF